jgi:hypothetical protein
MEEGVCFQQLGIQLVSSKVYKAELNSQMIHKQYPLKFLSTIQSYLPERNLKPSNKPSNWADMSHMKQMEEVGIVILN